MAQTNAPTSRAGIEQRLVIRTAEFERKLRQPLTLSLRYRRPDGGYPRIVHISPLRRSRPAQQSIDAPADRASLPAMAPAQWAGRMIMLSW
jgi:hypothetical protein